MTPLIDIPFTGPVSTGSKKNLNLGNSKKDKIRRREYGETDLKKPGRTVESGAVPVWSTFNSWSNELGSVVAGGLWKESYAWTPTGPTCLPPAIYLRMGYISTSEYLQAQNRNRLSQIEERVPRRKQPYVKP